MGMIFSLIVALAGSPPQVAEARMTPDRMIAIIEKVGRNVQKQDNVVQFTFRDVPMALVFDEEADRMRVISPIMEVEELEEGMLMKAMEANFHSVLDARYAVSGGMVWSAFIHPMSDLSDSLFASAIRQVAIARLTFGTEYSSGELIFGDPEQGEPPAPDRFN